MPGFGSESRCVLVPRAALMACPLQNGEMATSRRVGAGPPVPRTASGVEPLEGGEVAGGGGSLAVVPGQREGGVGVGPNEKGEAAGVDESVPVRVSALGLVRTVPFRGIDDESAACKRGGGKLAADKSDKRAGEGVAVADNEGEQFDVEVDDGFRTGVSHVERGRWWLHKSEKNPVRDASA